MPLTRKGQKILRAMRTTYGARAKNVLYASRNKGRIRGIDRRRATRRTSRRTRSRRH